MGLCDSITAVYRYVPCAAYSAHLYAACVLTVSTACKHMRICVAYIALYCNSPVDRLVMECSVLL